MVCGAHARPAGAVDDARVMPAPTTAAALTGDSSTATPTVSPRETASDTPLPSATPPSQASSSSAATHAVGGEHETSPTLPLDVLRHILTVSPTAVTPGFGVLCKDLAFSTWPGEVQVAVAAQRALMKLQREYGPLPVEPRRRRRSAASGKRHHKLVQDHMAQQQAEAVRRARHAWLVRAAAQAKTAELQLVVAQLRAAANAAALDKHAASDHAIALDPGRINRFWWQLPPTQRRTAARTMIASVTASGLAHLQAAVRTALATDSRGQPSVVAAAAAGDAELCLLLLEAYPDLPWLPAAKSAAVHGHWEACAALFSTAAGTTSAADNEDLGCILESACRHAQWELAEQALQRLPTSVVANQELVHSFVHASDAACLHGNAALMQLLLSHPLAAHLPDVSFVQAAEKAASAGHWPLCSAALTHGPTKEWQWTQDTWSVLYWAVHRSQSGVCRQLLQHFNHLPPQRNAVHACCCHLRQAVKLGDAERVQWLLQLPLSRYFATKDSVAEAAQEALRGQHTEVVRLLREQDLMDRAEL